VGRPPVGAVGPRGGRLVCMRDIFILNEIRAQDEIYIFVGTLRLKCEALFIL
jgi:hypothetical protein